MSIQIKDFLNAFSTDSTFGMHLPVFWTVTIDGVEFLDINEVIAKARHKWAATITPKNMTTPEGNILVAQSVTLPTESSTFSPMVMSNMMGGFLPGHALDARANFLDRNFSINFIETQTDIIHQFFRPWMIAIGIKGLIETSPNLKSTIEVIQWSNGNPDPDSDGSQMALRGFRFRKAFPTAVEGYTYDYGNTDFPIKSVTFACDDYEQIEVLSPENTNNTPLNTPPQVLNEK